MPKQGETKILEIGVRENLDIMLEYAGLIKSSGEDTFSIIRHRDSFWHCLFSIPSFSPLYFPRNKTQISIDRRVYDVTEVSDDSVTLTYRGKR